MKNKGPDIYRRLADLIYFCHWIWVGTLCLLLILGSLGYLWAFPIFCAIMFTTLIAQFLFSGCPLTFLENSLRKKYDPETPDCHSCIGSFLKRHFNIDLAPGLITAILIILFIMALIPCLIFLLK